MAPATKPSTRDRLTLIKFSVPSTLAAHMRFIGEQMGWGVSHTDVAKFLLMREVSRLQEEEAHKKRVLHLPLIEEGEE